MRSDMGGWETLLGDRVVDSKVIMIGKSISKEGFANWTGRAPCVGGNVSRENPQSGSTSTCQSDASRVV